MPDMPDLEALRGDHRRLLAELDAVEALLERRASSASAAAHARALRAAVELSGRLERQFATHLAAEDTILYPAVARRIAGGADLVAPLHAEHRELRLMLADLLETLARPAGRARDEQVFVRVRDLVDLLRIHIRKEETLVFGVAERMTRPGDVAALETRRSRPAGPRAPRKPPRSRKGTPR